MVHQTEVTMNRRLPPSAARTMSDERLRNLMAATSYLSVRDLKDLIAEAGLSCDDCLDRGRVV